MKKFFTLVVGALMLSISANATTPFKNLYVEAEVYPSGAGEVYLTAKNDEDAAYVADQSEDYGETAYIMETIGENGDPSQYSNREGYQIDASGTLGNYEVGLYITPAEGYELVCVAKEIKESGEYVATDCYQSHTGTGTDSFVFSWDFDTTDNMNLVNANSETRPQDGTSDDEGGRDGVFNAAVWSDTPDTKFYVIFREIGATTPSFDPTAIEYSMGDVNVDGVVDVNDAKAIANKVLWGTGIVDKYADVNEDGALNIADAVKIINNLK